MINAPWGIGIGARHITISTSGLVPKIISLAQQPQQYRLAISLHAATDPVRSQIMPINQRYPIPQLLDACKKYQKAKGRLITFEYILIADLNDSEQQARLLVDLARRVQAKINLIPYNTVEGLPWRRPTENTIRAFAKTLQNQGIKVTIRQEKGHDIDAACGQLRLKQLPNQSPSVSSTITSS
jgi:23S rRNA (adenine2503-C2)-methyltransferase